MKKINIFLKEQLSNQRIKGAMGVIQELTVDYLDTDNTYSDKEIQDVINGVIEPEYKEIYEYILDVWMASDNKSDDVIDILNNKEEYLEDINIAILRGFQDYLDNK